MVTCFGGCFTKELYGKGWHDRTFAGIWCVIGEVAGIATELLVSGGIAHPLEQSHPSRTTYICPYFSVNNVISVEVAINVVLSEQALLYPDGQMAGER